MARKPAVTPSNFERELGRLEATVEAQGAQIAALNESIKSLKETLDGLTHLLEQAKGGSAVVRWLFPLGSGAIGALLMKFSAIIFR